ncbi:iron chelate uptake ABC transporter family permease subunit [Palleronia abyssalis]|uniref:Ferric enterobactin transport system permease protein FepD n=1 Tax=Palleronia abyssalis TaxID=1501240 RepID=A0A2R8BYS0_9RHOB|nr:iron chelate uptake ABC transporter family permease subunit [Palleronia abyssalis]SPJ25300.1 Ferric enterobactin transport system permease protein FepD [Palleronia abyssalis]
MVRHRLLFLSLGLGCFTLLFLGWHLRTPVGLILSLRAEKLAALVLVGAAVGNATVLFQTAAQNRLITPGIVGFDALFVFLQTMLVLILGGAGYSGLSPLPKFAVETGCLVLAATALFAALLRKGAEDVLRMILTGVILGVLLRGLSGFAQRILEPSEFAVVQQASIASFGAVDARLLPIAGAALVIAMALSWRLSPRLDVAALGRTKAQTLGLPFDRTILAGLSLVSVMVAVATALVGPVTFLGLLAANLAYRLTDTHRHAVLIPAAAMIGATILIAGQFAFERVLGLQSSLSVVVEFAGGLLFLALVLRRDR